MTLLLRNIRATAREIRLLDKISSFLQFLERGILEVEDERVDDAFVDLINYAALLYALIVRRLGEKV